MHFCSIFTKISVFILLGAVHHTESIMIPLKKITLVITFQQNNGAEPAASCLRLCANGTESKSVSVKESFGKRPRMHLLLRAASKSASVKESFGKRPGIYLLLRG